MGNPRRDITINASDLMRQKKAPPAKPVAKQPVKKVAAGDSPVAKQASANRQDGAFNKKPVGAKDAGKKKKVKPNAFGCTMFALLGVLLGMAGIACAFLFPPLGIPFGIGGVFAALASKRRIGKFDRNPQWVAAMLFSVAAIVVVLLFMPRWFMRMQSGQGELKSPSTYENMIDGMSGDAKDASDKFGSFWDKYVDPILPEH